MKLRTARLPFLYMLLLAAMAVSGWQLTETNSFAATCCSVGTDCGTGVEICCTPGSLGAMDCSTDKKGYCRASCGMDVE